MTETRLLTTEEVAEVLRVSTVYVRKLLREKRIKGRKVGRDWRVEESELLKFVHGEGNN